jgi:DNA-binding beta-propeller fold protein YncE
VNASCQCPSADDLRELLDGIASDVEQSAITAHLDHCPSCQQSIEALAGGDSSLAVTLQEQRVLVTPKSDSAYWPALDKVTVLAVGTPNTPRPRSDVSLKFLDPPADGSNLGTLNNFTITRMIGRGGMGVVLQATDTCLERDVAIKVLDPELANDELARTRFCREARAAASISHENVVAVHQVEHEEGKDLPFLVMELISGESLETKIAREGRLSLREIVSIGMQTAAGLAAAHEKNLIHRDIKPGNILLEKSGQRVKLTDFGLARAAEDVRLTRSGLVAGTPLYMSPEQASGEDLDARSDLFSLGVVLYELAAGEPPFNGKTPLAVLKRLTEAQPQPLHERNPDLPEWFVNIVDKLLAKKPQDRFQTARDVAATLEHFWALMKSSENVICPKKRAASQWNSVVLGIAAGAVTLLLGATALFFLMPPRERAEDKIPPPLHMFKGNGGPIWSMAVSRDGKNLATGTENGDVKFWDIPAERVLWTLSAHKTPIWTLALSPRGDVLATGSDDGHTKIWDVASQSEIHTLPKIGGVRAVAFDAEGQRLVTGGRDGTVKIWDVATGTEIGKTLGHENLVAAVAFSPDGKTLASSSSDKTIKVWDAVSGTPKFTLTGHESGVYAIAFSPKDRRLVSGGWDRTVRVWDLDSGSQIAKLDGPTQDVWSVAYSPDGALFASTGEDQMVRLWDATTNKELRSFRGASGAILNVRFTEPGGIIVGTKEGAAYMWNWNLFVPR